VRSTIFQELFLLAIHEKFLNSQDSKQPLNSTFFIGGKCFRALDIIGRFNFSKSRQFQVLCSHCGSPLQERRFGRRFGRDQICNSHRHATYPISTSEHGRINVSIKMDQGAGRTHDVLITVLAVLRQVLNQIRRHGERTPCADFSNRIHPAAGRNLSFCKHKKSKKLQVPRLPYPTAMTSVEFRSATKLSAMVFTSDCEVCEGKNSP
jgi:hypothetical protein